MYVSLRFNEFNILYTCTLDTLDCSLIYYRYTIQFIGVDYISCSTNVCFLFSYSVHICTLNTPCRSYIYLKYVCLNRLWTIWTHAFLLHTPCCIPMNLVCFTLTYHAACLEQWNRQTLLLNRKSWRYWWALFCRRRCGQPRKR
jgi:hypothetical protein